MYDRRFGQPIDFIGPTPPPRDFLVLLGVLFVTYSLSFIPSTRFLVELLYLSPGVWQSGYLWQILSYPFAALPVSPIWFLISLLILFMFGREVRSYLGRRHFWRLVLWSAGAASIAAVLVELLISLTGSANPAVFTVMQGDRMLLTILVAAFATVHPNAVIRLFFILPIRARSFLWLEILFAFVLGFLPTLDFSGFVGVCVAVGWTYAMLTGGVPRALRELRLRFEKLFIELRLRHLRKRRKIRLVKPDEGGDAKRGPWIN